MGPGQLLVLIDGRCGGLAVKSEDGAPAGLFRMDLVDPSRLYLLLYFFERNGMIVQCIFFLLVRDSLRGMK
jgi:hypothetical protein